MQHRHLSTTDLTPAAIDDIVGRGKLADWIALRDAVKGDSMLAEVVLQICRAHLGDPTEQRYYLWKHYAERQLA